MVGYQINAAVSDHLGILAVDAALVILRATSSTYEGKTRGQPVNINCSKYISN